MRHVCVYSAFQMVASDAVVYVLRRDCCARCLRHPNYFPFVLNCTMHADDIEDDVIALCRELCLSGKCIYSASNEQLLADGYRANAATAQLSFPQQTFDLCTSDFKMKLRSDNF